MGQGRKLAVKLLMLFLATPAFLTYFLSLLPHIAVILPAVAIIEDRFFPAG